VFKNGEIWIQEMKEQGDEEMCIMKRLYNLHPSSNTDRLIRATRRKWLGQALLT
jgi:exosome complex RNA-binding protein Rrp4